MTWPRIDDNVMDHPKMLHAEALFPDFAWVLWSRALLYTNKHRLDGRVPAHVLSSFIASKKVRVRDVAAALVAAGLWEQHGDDFVFHDFASWNLTKAAREEAARANREKQQRFRERHRDPPPEPSNPSANQPVTGYAPVSNQTEDGHVTGSEPVRDPSCNHPVTEVSLTRAGVGARAPSHPIPSHPILSLSEAAQSAERDKDPEEPSEGEMFAAYAKGVSQALGFPAKHPRDEKNVLALSTVWGSRGYGKVAKAEFLAKLTTNAAQYVAAAIERGQPAQFEAQFAPYRFLAWVQAHEAGLDPWPSRGAAGQRAASKHVPPRGPGGGRPTSSAPRLDAAASRLLATFGGSGR